MVNFGRIAFQFWQRSAQLRRNFSTIERPELIFRTYSMHDYDEIQTALIDLCRRCEDTNQASVMGSRSSQSLVLFHCEFTDYLRCMEQYPESYCHTLVESNDNRVVAALLTNFKRLHFGSYMMTGGFARLIRVDPGQRRKNVGIYVMQAALEQVRRRGMDYCLGYTLATNVASMTLQRKLSGSIRTENYQMNIFVVPTQSNPTVTQLYKLTPKETERLWTVDLAHWVNRPVLSDLRYIMQMNEYLGTFAVGDFPTGRYAAASVWQSPNMILCDDRSNMKNAYRGPYRLVFNFFQSPTMMSCSDDEKRKILSALSSAAAIDGIPFILCHIDQSSPFSALCQERAVAVAKDIMTRDNFSSHITILGDEFDKFPTWLDPRDFSGLLYFSPVFDKDPSQL